MIPHTVCTVCILYTVVPWAAFGYCVVTLACARPAQRLTQPQLLLYSFVGSCSLKAKFSRSGRHLRHVLRLRGACPHMPMEEKRVQEPHNMD